MRQVLDWWLALSSAIWLMQAADGSSCYPLQDGARYGKSGAIALAICHPDPSTSSCEHCTHAGSRTACWLLDSRCLSDTLQGKYKLQNWGYSAAEERWMQNHDQRGNFKTVSSVCRDSYGGYCFTELESVTSRGERRRSAAALALCAAAWIGAVL